ncbi:hypothetical protein [Nitrobacter sp. TKz-YC01]|uniref:hypothetical protein n=1 Tax=Nitrobacter sp. TKz-YC01 TaxID=3398703 RepID=UPI003A1010CC
MMLPRPETSHGQNTIPQSRTSISDGDQAHKVRAPFLDQNRQSCTGQEDHLNTSPIVGSAGAASQWQQASPGHRDADEA